MTFLAQIPDGQAIEPAREAMLATIEGIAKEPITEAEVARVRAKAAKYYDDVLANPQAFGVAISESIALGDWRLFFLRRDRYRTVTPADVQRVALVYLKRSNLTIGEFLPDPAPDRAPMPPAVDVAAMVKDYKGDVASTAGETFDPSPANLDARTQRVNTCERHEGGAAAQEDARRGGQLQPVAALRRREVRLRQGVRGRGHRRHADPRHDDGSRGRKSRTRSTRCAPRSRSAVRKPAPPRRARRFARNWRIRCA